MTTHGYRVVSKRGWATAFSHDGRVHFNGIPVEDHKIWNDSMTHVIPAPDTVGLMGFNARSRYQE